MCDRAVMGSAPATAMTRPVLRPGIHAVRRDDAHLQLGLDAPDRLVLTDRPGLLDALRALPRIPHDPAVLQVVESLAEAGWVVDDHRPEPPARPPLALTADALLVDAVARACRAAGVVVADSPGPTLVATVGEPRRDVSDDLMRHDVAHLWLAVFPTSVRVGPFVEPGRTACLRCIDARLGDCDPRRATVLHQLGERPAGTETAHDAALALVGAGLALRDVARHLAGEPSGLRSTTLAIGADLVVTRQAWLRHPHCGCAWG